MKAIRSSITGRLLGLVLLEAALIALAVGAATWLLLGEHARLLFRVEHGGVKTLLVAIVCQACLYYCDLYDLRNLSDRRGLFVSLFQALGATSLILAFMYFWFPALMLGRGVFAVSVIFVIATIFSWRLLVDWLAGRVRPRERILIIGTNAGALELAREVNEHRAALGVEIAGFVHAGAGGPAGDDRRVTTCGAITDIPDLVRAHRVDRVVVSLEDSRGKLPMEQLLEMKLGSGVAFDHLPSVYEEYTGKIAVENLRPSWLIFSDGFRKSRGLLAAKRAIDLGAGALGLVLTFPLMLLTACLVRLSSPGPVLYHQTRVGLDGRTFTVHKFRSMVANAEAGTGAVWARQNDSRITPIGRFLRRSRLDELPQLWNVLRGDMSLVGPRPERPEFVDSLTQRIPFYGQRHVVRPGLTGWAQVRYTYGASVEDAMEKLQYDLFYVKNLSIALDLFVMFLTVKTVIQRKGA
jgi:sugar transferase (PEP-CTERM system associated)